MKKWLNKRKIFLPIIFILILVVIAGVIGFDAQGLVPTVLADGTQTVVEQVKDKSNDVYAEIQKNIDMVNDLKVTIETMQDNGGIIPLYEIMDSIKEVTESYETLAHQQDSIRENLLAKISKIQDMQNRVVSEIERLKDRKADYLNQIQSLSTSSNAQIILTRIKALDKAAAYIDDQITLWENFNVIEENISTQMSAIQEQLDSFLGVIQSSAILFREGLNLLQLQSDINNALSLFTSDLPEMSSLTQGMVSSWDTLDYLVNTLNNLSETYTGN